MANRKKRLKRKKKKTNIATKLILSILLLAVIGLFLLYLFNRTNGIDIEKTIITTCKQTTNGKKVKIQKDFDEKGNLLFRVSIPVNKKARFKQIIETKLKKRFHVKEINAGSKTLIKIDTGNEIVKLLIIPEKAQKRKKTKTVKKEPQYQYEEPIKEGKTTLTGKPEIKVKGQPLLAIIIDDCGIGHMEAFKKAIQIPYPITFAILPFRRYSKKCSFLAHGKGYQVILHMPMQPVSYPKADPGPGAIMITDGKKEIVEKLLKAFSNIAFAKGFNNHMGSAVTQSRFAVRVILSYAHNHNKFFIDSRTTPKTVVPEEAKRLNIKVLSRDVFLDNIIEPSQIKKQLEEAVKKAYRHGYAIAIGHNYPTTIKTLSIEMPLLDKKVNFVFVRDIYNALK